MEHNKEYQSGRYRVVEQIERVKEGFRVSVTAYDDQTAKELNGHSKSISRFDARWVAATLDAARRDLAIAINLMNRSIASDMPQSFRVMPLNNGSKSRGDSRKGDDNRRVTLG